VSEVRRRLQLMVLQTAGGLLVALALIPVVAVVLSTTRADLLAGLHSRAVWQAVRLSLTTSCISLALVTVLGTPLAWTLARSDQWWSPLTEAVLRLPAFIPPAVSGLGLLLAFGRQGPLGNSSLAFTSAAVVLAQVFVGAPFFLQAATSAFRRVDSALLLVARTFGASPFRLFFQVALPLAFPGIAAGAVMCWARALGEFGATLMFAGNLEGVTQTLPLVIYTALETDGRVSKAVSVLLVAIAVLVLLTVRMAEGRLSRKRGSP
jgi:molybdate transport system permease protein